MKKKILAIALAVAVLAITAIGITLAYFTDTDAETNVFTAGGVAINLIEQQVNDEHTEIEDFEQNQVLMPIVGSAQGDKDQFGQPMAKNYCDKMITIENTGKSGAYVRAYFAIPSALDDGYETFNAGLNVLHFNFGNYKTEDGTWATTYEEMWNWKHGEDNKWNYYETTIEGVAYNVYYADYYQVLAVDATTEQFVSGVYLDKSFDMTDGTYYAFGEPINLSALIDDNGNLNIKCPVMAVAVQADGFDSVDAAITAAFGANYNPFGGTATNWQ